MQPSVTVSKSVYADIVLPITGQTKIFKYTLDNGFISVEVINYGATIVAVNVPDSEGYPDNVILGYDDIIGYLNTRNPYLGGTVGRYAHRIAGAAFSLKDQVYYLSKNDGHHTLHGGVQGFDRKVWGHRVDENTVVMTYRSYDLEEGFPGDLCVTARFILTNQNQLIVVYKAIPSNMTTPVNITNQLYFNLSGDFTSSISEHHVKVYSEYKAVMQEEGDIPTGETEELESSENLKKYTRVSRVLEQNESADIKSGKSPADALKMESVSADVVKDNATADNQTEATSARSKFTSGTYYCIEGLGVRPHAKLKDESSGRAVQIFSDQACLYLSVGNELADLTASKGKWTSNSGILLQTGNFPDAVHHDKFPTPWVQPRRTYQHTILYKFRVSKLDCSDEEDGAPRPPEPTEEEALQNCYTVKKVAPKEEPAPAAVTAQ